jgi:hypothetical protein
LKVLAVRFRADHGLLQDVLNGRLPRHLPEVTTHGGVGMKVERAARCLVGEEDALVGINGDDSLDHSTEDCAQLFAIGFKLLELQGQSLAHGVKRPGQRPALAPDAAVNAMAVFACRNSIGTLRE